MENNKSEETAKKYYESKIEIKHGDKQKHHSDLLPDGPILGLILGRSGCGKSSLLVKLVPYIAKLGAVVICSIIPGVESHEAIRQWCAENDILFAFVDNPNEAQEVIEELTEAKEDAYGVIIMDDFNRGRKAYTCPFTQLSVMCYQMLRNKRWHSITLTQSYLNVDTLIRNNSNIRCLFGTNDIYALEAIKRDIANMGIDIGLFNRVYNQVRAEDHAYCLITNECIKLANKANNFTPTEIQEKPEDELRRLVQEYQSATGLTDKKRLKARIANLYESLGL
jgi:hypothetical protein